MFPGEGYGLELVGVYDRGIPNKERIMLRVAREIDMASFAILIANQSTNGEAIPYVDQFFWFGNGALNSGDVIFVYTGPGKATKSIVQGTSIPAYVLHWGKPETVFADSSIVPVVVKMEPVAVGTRPWNLPQKALPPN